MEENSMKIQHLIDKADVVVNRQFFEYIQNFLVDDNQRELRLPSSITEDQINVLISWSAKLGFTVQRDWFFPITDVLIRKKGVSNGSECRPVSMSLEIETSVQRQMLRIAGIRLKKSRSNEQYKNNFNIFSYFETKPKIPRFLQHNQHAQLLPGNNIDRLVEKMILFHKHIQIISGLGKEDKLNLLIKLNNDCSTKMQPCRIVYLQCSSIGTFWMSLKLKKFANDKWNSVGYQITLESKTSLNNTIIFFEIATFIRVMNRDPNMRLITHLMIDIEQNHLFFNLLFLYIKENLEELSHLNIYLLTTDLAQSEQMKNYFPMETSYTNFTQYQPDSIPMSEDNLEFYFLEDIEQIKSVLPFEPLKNQETNVSIGLDDNIDAGGGGYNPEIMLIKCWQKKIQVSQMIDYFRMFPDYIDFQCKNLNGITGLIVATVFGTTDNVYQLLALGADCRIPSWNNMEPIQWAIYYRRSEIFQLLFTHHYSQNVTFDLNLQHCYLKKFMLTSLLPEKNVDDGDFPKLPPELCPSIFDVDYGLIISLLSIMVRQLYFNYESHMVLSPDIVNDDDDDDDWSIGSILIMMPSYSTISTLRKLILSAFAGTGFELIIFCLHANVSNNELDGGIDILNYSTKKVRIILSTFNADTVLLEDIQFVINTGVRLEKFQSNFSNINLFRLICDEQNDPNMRGILLNQRTPVKVFNLFKRTDPSNEIITLKNNQTDQSLPSIITNVSTETMYHCIFVAKCLNFENNNIMDIFNRMISKPKPEIISISLDYLKNVKVLNQMEELTELGKVLIDLSIEPHYAKMIVFSLIFRCLDPILTIVSSLSSSVSAYLSDIIQICLDGQQKQSHLDMEKGVLDGFSDHLLYIYAFQIWQEASRASNSNVKINNCQDLKVDSQDIIFSAFEMIYSLRTKILGQLRAIGFVKGKGPLNIRQLNCNSENFSVVKAAICAGQMADHFTMIMSKQSNRCGNITDNDGDGIGMNTRKKIIHIDPDSVLNSLNPNLLKLRTHPVKLPSNLVLYDKIINCGQVSYIQNCTLINPLTMAIFSDELSPGSIIYRPGQNDNIIQFNGLFNIVDSNNQKVFALRQQWQQFSKKRLFNLQQSLTVEEETFLNDIIQLITVSDENSGFRFQLNIGRPPLVMSTYFCSTVQVKK